MLSKVNRIRKKKDFEIVFKNSKSFKNNLFIFRIIENNLGLNRFGFVVSQKVSKKSVVRNKVRRRLTEIMKAKIKDIKNGTDVVIITLPGIEKKKFSELKDVMNESLAKAKLID